MRKRILFFLLLLIGNVCLAQIKGKVVDGNNQPVQAYIHVLNTNLVTATDDQGAYSLDVPAGKYQLAISALGYADAFQSVDSRESTEINITLTEAVVRLDNIVVTAEKQETDVQSVPYSISAIGSKKVTEYRVWNTRDITAIVPNLFSANPGDGRNVTSIRGITSSSYDPAIATYVDGVNQFSLDTYIPQLLDIERIEVLRGPQGTLYGRNAMGGVINIVTKQPTNRRNAFVDLSVGSYGQQRLAGGVKAPIVKDKLFFGGSWMREASDGFYDNEFDNSDFDKRSNFIGNYFLTWAINSKWNLTLNTKHSANRNNGAFPLNYLSEEGGPLEFKVNQNDRTELVDNSLNSSLKLNYAGSKVNIMALATYQSNYRYYKTPIDGDFSPADIISINNNYGKDWNNVKVLTGEFRISSPASNVTPFKWSAGAYFFNQDNPTKQATMFGENGDIYGAQPFSSTINTSTGTNLGFASYAQGTYTFADKFDITLGARLDSEERELKGKIEYQQDPDPNPMFDIVPDTAATSQYSAFSFKGSLGYRFKEGSQVYATFSRGYRTGGITQVSADPSQGMLYKYDPEFSDNYEVGVKNTFFDQKLVVNFTAFLVKIKDIQVPTLILPENVTVTRNAGKLTSKGIELELAASPVRGLLVEYNWGLTDATYDNLLESRQIFTPRYTSMLAVQYTYAFDNADGLHVFARGEWMSLGKQYFDLANNISQDAYSLLNARAGVVFRGYEISFWSRNITDETYISYAYDFGAVHLGAPANAGVTLRKTFSF